MLSAASSFTSSREINVVRMSAMRQLRSRYRGTVLGVLWSFANPVLMTALYAVLFGTAFAKYYDGSVKRYVFAVFVAVLLVTFFSQATSEALTSVVSNGGLLNKIAIDAEVFPIASLTANAFQQALTTFPVIVVLTALVTHDPLRVVLAPVVLGAFVAMVAGFALTLAAMYVFFRDLAYLWGVTAFVFWMTSPVFYPAALVPARIRPWFDINPIGLGIDTLRSVALGQGAIDWLLIGRFLGIAIVLLAIGHAIFRATRKWFIDLV